MYGAFQNYFLDLCIIYEKVYIDLNKFELLFISYYFYEAVSMVKRRKRILLLALIYAYMGIRNRHYRQKKAFVDPDFSPWKKLYLQGDDIDLIECTGLNRAAFELLHQKLYVDEVENCLGRHRILNSRDKLGMYLHYLNSSMKYKSLSQLFGVTAAIVSRTIAEIRKLMCKKLVNDVDCRVEWPSFQQQRDLYQLILQREPTLHVEAFGFIDGCSFPCSTHSSVDEQNAYYNGWKSGTFVNNVFVFSPEGRIIFASINAPGSWHDAALCGDLFSILLNNQLTLESMGVIADTAFPRTGPLNAKIFCGLRQDEISADTNAASVDILRHSVIT